VVDRAGFSGRPRCGRPLHRCAVPLPHAAHGGGSRGASGPPR
jgi:hypothetical protein